MASSLGLVGMAGLWLRLGPWEKERQAGRSRWRGAASAPLLWAVPLFPGPWGRPSSEVELELLRAQRYWLETVKKMIEEQIREVDKRFRKLEDEVKASCSGSAGPAALAAVPRC